MKTTQSLIALFIASGLAGFGTGAFAETNPHAGTACETQAVPAMPRSAMQGMTHDQVKVRALVRDGAVHNVEILKGSHSYGNVIRTAMDKYRCRVQDSEFWVTQDFDFDARDH